MAILQTLSHPDEGLTLSMGGKLYRVVVRDALRLKSDTDGYTRWLPLDEPVMGLEEIKK